MAQKFDCPKTETELHEIQDKLYQHSKEVHNTGGRPAFKGLLEIMSAEATIITAIHNIKSNHGSETPGVDSKTMRKDYTQQSICIDGAPCAVKVACTVRSGGKSALTAEHYLFSKSGGLPIAIMNESRKT